MTKRIAISMVACLKWRSAVSYLVAVSCSLSTPRVFAQVSVVEDGQDTLFRLADPPSDEEIEALKDAGLVTPIGIPSQERFITPCENDFRDYTCYGPGQPCVNAAFDTQGKGVVSLFVVTRDATGARSYWQATGFLISQSGRRDIIMTAAHAFAPGRGGPNGIPANHSLYAISAQFHYAYALPCVLGGPACLSPLGAACSKPQNKVGCTAIADNTCDWGIIKLRQNAPLTAQPLTLVSEALPVDVYSIQHPGGRCKEADGTSDIDSATDIGDVCLFGHSVDTEPGSSGAPVFSSSGVIGVHVQGGCVVGDPPPPENKATRMSMVLVGLPGAITAVDAVSTCDLAAIPTLSEWGVAVMTLLVLTAATIVLLRRRSSQPA